MQSRSQISLWFHSFLHLSPVGGFILTEVYSCNHIDILDWRKIGEIAAKWMHWMEVCKLW
jgi:hypothetical protein